MHTRARVLAIRLLATLLLTGAARAGHAQVAVPILTGQVIDAVGKRPVSLAEIVVDGKSSVFADTAGNFRVAQISPGQHQLRVRRVGYRFVDRTIQIPPSGPAAPLLIALEPIAIKLEQLVVEAPKACRRGGIREDAEPALVEIYSQLRLGADQYIALTKKYPFESVWDRVTSMGTGKFSNVTRNAEWNPNDIEVKYRRGGGIKFDRTPGNWTSPFLGLANLADESFVDGHCFKYAGADSVGPYATVRIHFEPLASIDGPDYEGDLWLDATTAQPRRLRYRVTNMKKDWNPSRLEGTTYYKAPVTGFVVADSSMGFWWERPDGQSDSPPPPDARQMLKLRAIKWLKGKPGEQQP